MQERAIKVAKRELESRGYRIIDTDYDSIINIIAKHDGCTVFVMVKAGKLGDDFMDVERFPRAQAELAAMFWMAEYGCELGPVRFDMAEFAVFGNGGALFRLVQGV